jgi:hypothetical protein
MTDKERKIREALKRAGSKLNLGELERIKRETGAKGGIVPIAKSMGIDFSSGVRNRNNLQPSVTIPGYGTPSAEEFLNPAVYQGTLAQNLGILTAQGGLDIANVNKDALIAVERIKKSSTLDISQLNLEGIKYASDRDLEGTKYASDRQLEGVLGAENIRAKGAIDLQGIINAGTANVENIRGEYGIKGKKIDRSTAILGSLVSSFNF